MARKLIIAGGGIGGMSAALALRRSGIDVTVCEQAPVFREAGTGMSLWPNATRILRTLGVLDEVLARGQTIARFNLLRPDGTTISTLAMDNFDTPALCIHRTDLHRALRQPLPSDLLKVNHQIEHFAQDSSGILILFANGESLRADGLIGADGVHSTILKQLHRVSPPVYRGYCVWRGVAPDLDGHDRGHISETWGAGQRFGILPIGQGRVCWYATRNRPSSPPCTPEEQKYTVQRLFRGWHHPISALIDATDCRDIMQHDARDRAPLRTWGRGRATLLGDAAHPLTPNVGQGACLAIEDAACLAKSLEVTPDLEVAFRSYENARKARTTFVARRARRIGAIGQWEHPRLIQARNTITRLVLNFSADLRLNPLYSYQG